MEPNLCLRCTSSQYLSVSTRLSELDAHGDFSLTKDHNDDVPHPMRYFQTLGEKVTFKDLEGTGKSKAGYKKIRFCGEQSRRDSIQYLWDGKCGIDKPNSTQLAEAITSLFTGTDP